MKQTLKHPYNIFFGTLANQIRLEIIMLLKSEPKNVTQISKTLGYQQPTVSKNLQRLETCGFVFCEEKGKESFYSLNRKTIQPLIEMMNAHVSQYCRHLHDQDFEKPKHSHRDHLFLHHRK